MQPFYVTVIAGGKGVGHRILLRKEMPHRFPWGRGKSVIDPMRLPNVPDKERSTGVLLTGKKRTSVRTQ